MMTTALRRIRLADYHPNDLTYPDVTPYSGTDWRFLFLQFYPGIMMIFEGETVEQAYTRWYEGTVRHEEYMRTECPMCAGMVDSIEYHPTSYERVEKALSDTTPLPDDIGSNLVRILTKL